MRRRSGPDEVVDVFGGVVDAIIRLSATGICGSDLWPYRGLEALEGAPPMGHEYCGIVEEVGIAVTTIGPCQFVGSVADRTAAF